MNNNYRTLHKDIGLIQRSNNGWDLWFDNGDTVQATEFHSLQVAIIIACLTSWNYLNRYGNPTYEIFGNRSYQLLKANKSEMVRYKIQQYFIECLKRMRRVYEVISLKVYDIPQEPHKYYVDFTVLSINNQLVDGNFIITDSMGKSTSHILYNVYMPYASNENPLIIDLWLRNEYGGGIADQILYIYLKRGDNDYVLLGVTDKTDADGYVRVTYEPNWDYDKYESDVIYFDFRGNTTYNPSTSQRTSFITECLEYHLSFIDPPSTTDSMHNQLKVLLTEKDKRTEEIRPKQQITILLEGSDGSVYESTTNQLGEAIFNVSIDDSFNEDIITKITYTAYYDIMVEHTINITRRTPVLEVTVNEP